MTRRLRLRYPGVIYYLMARGNGRQEIVRDDADRVRLQEHHGKAAIRCSWRIYAFAIMSNHPHLVLKTPQPNLAREMQIFLSGYANAWSRRYKFSGHVFQGRYRTELVEDKTYPWTVTRYVHRNSVRAGSVDHGRILGSEAFIDRSSEGDGARWTGGPSSELGTGVD
jgi:putative transposase